MTCEQVTVLPPVCAPRARRRGGLLRALGLLALLSGGLSACGGQELVGDYAGSHSLIYELTSDTAGSPAEVVPVDYMGIISVYRQGDLMEIDLSKTCTLRGTQIARNGIALEDNIDARCMMKMRNIPGRCRASGNIPDVRLSFKSPMRIYLTKNQEITLEGDFAFHASEALPCRDSFIRASYSFRGTASEL